jgi:hypothetical protein
MTRRGQAASLAGSEEEPMIAGRKITDEHEAGRCLAAAARRPISDAGMNVTVRRPLLTIHPKNGSKGIDSAIVA